MATYVQFTLLDGAEVQINPDEVFSLLVVSDALLPTGVADGTYIQDENGARVAVQGTVLATAAALTAGGPVAAAEEGVQWDAAGNVLSTTTGISSVTPGGAGVYLVAIAVPVTKGPLTATVTDPAVLGNPGTFVNAAWTGAGIIQVETAVLTAGAAVAQNLGASLKVMLP